MKEFDKTYKVNWLTYNALTNFSHQAMSRQDWKEVCFEVLEESDLTEYNDTIVDIPEFGRLTMELKGKGEEFYEVRLHGTER